MNKIVPALLLCSLTSLPAFASTEPANYGSVDNTQERTGVAAGLTLGAIAGGPPGAIIGAAIGALLGDGWKAKEQVGHLQMSLVQGNAQLSALKKENDRLQQLYLVAQQQLDSLKSQEPQRLNVAHSLNALSSCCDNTSLSLHFRTGSSDIESHYEDQLTALAKIVEMMPTSRIEIIGYADRNGDSDQNLALSKRRSDQVKVFFNELGIKNTGITTVAYGETQPLDTTQNFESDFFDRRVVVRLRDTRNQMLTHTPD